MHQLDEVAHQDLWLFITRHRTAREARSYLQAGFHCSDVLTFARGLGCNVVRFDRDADAVALPSYDWEATDKVAA